MSKYKCLSRYKIEKIMKYFCVDIDATKMAELLGFNRNTINRYHKLFREAVATYQSLEKDKIMGVVEADEHPTRVILAGRGLKGLQG